MSDMITLTVSRMAILAAVDSIIDLTIRDEFTSCRDLHQLVAECGGGCEDDMAFLRAARAAGIDVASQVEYRLQEVHDDCARGIATPSDKGGESWQ